MSEQTQQAARVAILAFDDSGLVYLRRRDGRLTLGAEAPEDANDEEIPFRGGKPVFIRNLSLPSGPLQLFFARDNGAAGEVEGISIEGLRREIVETPEHFTSELREVIEALQPADLVRAVYLEKGRNDYLYQFRTERQRNREVYRIDDRSSALYQSELCEAIKAARRVNERSSGAPAELDFGAVSYILPSHFGFCLGVQNAIERAYECLAENPGRPVYMLSELIHNPFVNEDLAARGLRCLQSDRGESVRDPATGRLYWDLLQREDVVVIPAFGATDEDKARLIEKGISIKNYDATCMLVEKVWKAAERFGEEGYTVIIHGKAEHEETKATFSNASKTAPSLIVRNMEEAHILGEIISASDRDEKERRFAAFAGRHTTGFDVERDLERIAVVNQTTLLRNETLRIIEMLEDVFARKFGRDRVAEHLNTNSKGDTLCYATQVNQDALGRALARDPTVAIVAGGRNSSNTYQLYRMCAAQLGERAFYIQSEENIPSAGTIRHYQFPSQPGAGPGDLIEKPFLTPPAFSAETPCRILLTGGASCPDGILQRVITRINGLFPPDQMKPIDSVIEKVE